MFAESTEHWLPELLQHIFKHKIGSLSYACESDASRKQLAKMKVKKTIREIETEKREQLYRSVSQAQSSSPKRDKFFSSRKFSGL